MTSPSSGSTRSGIPRGQRSLGKTLFDATLRPPGHLAPSPVIKGIVRELLPPAITRSLRYLRRPPRSPADAVSLELKRLREWPQDTATVTSILGRPFHLTDAREFLDLYSAYYQKQVCRFTARSARPFIIDCGAHIGVSVSWWKRLYPGARVLAFEADDVNFALLERNCSDLPDVRLINAAVWSADGEVKFVASGGDSGHVANVAESAVDTPSELQRRVRSVRLQSFLTEHCDLLKMDIEGAECEVLLDCADHLQEVDRIFVEYHSFVGREQFLARTISVLETAGFRLHAHVPWPACRPFEEIVGHQDMQLELFAYRSTVAPRRSPG